MSFDNRDASMNDSIEAQKIFFVRYKPGREMLKAYIRKCNKTNFIFEKHVSGDLVKVIIPALINNHLTNYETIVGNFKLTYRRENTKPLTSKKILFKETTTEGSIFVTDISWVCNCEHINECMTKHKIELKYVDVVCRKCNVRYRLRVNKEW